METKRLRTIQEPYRLERLLEAYVTRTNVVPKDAYQIRDPNAIAKMVFDRRRILGGGDAPSARDDDRGEKSESIAHTGIHPLMSARM